MHSATSIAFNRSTGAFLNASAIERLVARALRAGSRASAVFHHRGFSLGCSILRPLFGEHEIVVRLDEDAEFAFAFGDGYWSLLLDRGFHYEDEINRFLMSVADVEYGFLDCGANFGYWSVLASSRPFGSHPTLSVEASRRNFARLCRNAELNRGRFRTVHRAIGGSRGTAWLGGSKHAQLALSDNTAAHGERVEVVTLDDVLDDAALAACRRLVVKLDVEGMETAAIRSGTKLLERETMLIVEDHGSDRSHAVSRYLLKDTPFALFAFDGDKFVAVDDLSVLDRIKASTAVGYNVFATNSRFWEDRLLNAA